MFASQFVSNVSCQVPVPVSKSFLPDHDNEDNDIQQFWWDDYVGQFPSEFYSLLSPEEYEELFFGDDNDYDYATVECTYSTDTYDYSTDEYAYSTDQITTPLNAD